MSETFYKIMVWSGAFAVILMGAAIVSMIVTSYPVTGRVYNCSLAEISPDFPPEVRNECRKLRSEAHKNGRI